MDYDRVVSPAESRRISLTTGVLFLITFITSIPALWLYQPVLDDPVGYIAGAGADNRIFLGALLELLLIIANIGTAVVPSRPQAAGRGAAHSATSTARIMECTFIAVGILAVLAVVTPAAGPAGAGTDAASLGAVAHIAGRDQGLDVPARAGLRRRHRERAAAGLPDVPVGPGATADGHAGADRRPADLPLGDRRAVRRHRAGGPVQIIATIPEFIWELSLGIYLTVKGFTGFRPDPGGTLEGGDAAGPHGTPAAMPA